MARHRTSAEKAQQELESATKRYDRVMERVARLESQVAEAHERADALRSDKEFWASHPALTAEEEGREVTPADAPAAVE